MVADSLVKLYAALQNTALIENNESVQTGVITNKHVALLGPLFHFFKNTHKAIHQLHVHWSSFISNGLTTHHGV